MLCFFSLSFFLFALVSYMLTYLAFVCLHTYTSFFPYFVIRSLFLFFCLYVSFVSRFLHAISACMWNLLTMEREHSDGPWRTKQSYWHDRSGNGFHSVIHPSQTNVSLCEYICMVPTESTVFKLLQSSVQSCWLEMLGNSHFQNISVRSSSVPVQVHLKAVFVIHESCLWRVSHVLMSFIFRPIFIHRITVPGETVFVVCHRWCW